MTQPASRSRLLAVSRRALMCGTASLAAVAAIGSFVPAAHAERDVPVEDLMKPAEGLDDVALGPVDAKVVIVEYASLTCGHCGRFHREVFPEL
ncbi:MAG: thioredoxin domain-containing protein, partial [Hyphomicrobiaceae bacterium]